MTARATWRCGSTRSSGRRFPKANGVPEALIPWIAETSSQERQDGGSRRFETALQHDMDVPR